MSSERVVRRDQPKMESGRSGLIIAIIVAVVILVLFITLAIYFANKNRRAECAVNADCETGKICSNKKCVAPPTSPGPNPNPSPTCEVPCAPLNVEVVYDRIAKNATVTWSSSPGATSYLVYRKLNDPAVSPTNYDDVRTSLDSTEAYSNLPVGSSYFTVVAVNSCGKSLPSCPDFAPSCNVVPLTPSAPLITSDVDNCVNPQASEAVMIVVDEATGPRPIDIIEGTGQVLVDSYFVAFKAPLSPMTANLACTGQPVGFVVTHVSDAEEAVLLEPTGSITLGSSLTVKWQPIYGAEEYTVSIVAVDANGTDIFIGRYADADISSVELQVPEGSLLVFAAVHGYRICNKSNTSPTGFHIPPAII